MLCGVIKRRTVFKIKNNGLLPVMEASTGIEPVYTDLQSAASPLRQLAFCGVRNSYLILNGVASATLIQKPSGKRCRVQSDVPNVLSENLNGMV